MKPIGLTYKIETNRYARVNHGEIMIVHQCQNCKHVSCNRIAGDDNNFSIYCLLDNKFDISGITLLNQDDREEVLISIYGCNYKKYIK